jgi:hypothetical protein
MAGVPERRRFARCLRSDRGRRILSGAACALAIVACFRAPLRGSDFVADRDPYRREGHVDPERLEGEPIYRLLLAGDGGAAVENDPTLSLLGEWGDVRPERTAAIFLGDNIYPAGLQSDDRAQGERILRRQIGSTRARKVFIPGNHDWGFTGVQRLSPGVLGNQQAFLDSQAHLGVDFEPEDGCPGPSALELVEPGGLLPGGLTVLVLDLHWWLLAESERPVCEGIADTAAFLERFRSELKDRRTENVIVVAHHPIRSGGTHGGFTRGFWFDLGVSIFYRLYTVQDLIEPGYREMVRVLSEALAEHPPLAVVGGHDHSLQVLDGGDEARLVVVSGAASRITRVTSLESTLFAHAHLGFVVFDFHRALGKPDGVLLVHVVETGRRENPAFTLGLDLGREEAPPQEIPADEAASP